MYDVYTQLLWNFTKSEIHNFLRFMGWKHSLGGYLCQAENKILFISKIDNEKY
jgi:hypothetical protein